MGKKKALFFGKKGGLIDSIISEYKFEDNVQDTVGNNNGNATALTYESGLVGQTGVFNGSTSIVSIPDSNDLSFGNGTTDEPFSISLIYKVATNPIIDSILVEKTQLENFEFEYLVYLDFKGRIGFRLFGNGGNADWLQKEIPTPTSNSWYHLTFTYDGNGLTGMNIFLDGILQSTNTLVVGSYVAMNNTSASLNFGARTNDSLFFNGDLDCVRIWNKELSNEEVLEIATSELNGIDINP